MIFISYLIYGVIGLAAGIAVAGGVFAFITMIGVIPRLAYRSSTGMHTSLYEGCVVVGGTLGNIFYLFSPKIELGDAGLLIVGSLSGIFVGCLAMALAESLRLIPIMVRRARLRKGLPFLILALALGKLVGTFFQLYINYGK